MCRNQRTTVDKILQSHRPVSIQSKKGEINLGDDRTVLDVKEGCGTVGQGWWNSSHLHGQRATPKRTSFGNKAREIWRKDGIRLDIQRRLLVLMNMFSLTRGQSLAAFNIHLIYWPIFNVRRELVGRGENQYFPVLNRSQLSIYPSSPLITARKKCPPESIFR